MAGSAVMLGAEGPGLSSVARRRRYEGTDPHARGGRLVERRDRGGDRVLRQHLIPGDAPVGELDAARERDGVEQLTVVGDEEQGAGERAQRLLELLDGREVEVVGGLVEHEAVHAAGVRADSRRSPGAS